MQKMKRTCLFYFSSISCYWFVNWLLIFESVFEGIKSIQTEVVRAAPTFNFLVLIPQSVTCSWCRAFLFLTSLFCFSVFSTFPSLRELQKHRTHCSSPPHLKYPFKLLSIPFLKLPRSRNCPVALGSLVCGFTVLALGRG